ncbi:MAG: Grx4 family monothiol glutaredoxin [Gammaproteobacteria bacterium]|nr:Grx4 family monothiol glutaredoxin [Gammaproteobacteria bacterium]
MATLEKIKQQISENPIILYMKGSPEQPQCGFSARAAGILDQCGKPYATVDILANPDIRQELPKYANWPTFPQLYIKGELIGGSDIIAELFEQGDLQPMIDAVNE